MAERWQPQFAGFKAESDVEISSLVATQHRHRSAIGARSSRHASPGAAIT